MKTTCCLVFLVAGFFVAGCGRGDNPKPPTPTAAPDTAPPPSPTVSAPAPNTPAAAGGNGYLGAMGRAQQLAVKTVDLSSLNENCQLFNASEGRFPKDLNELVTTHYIPRLPDVPVGMKLSYDATQGKVTLVPQ